MKYKAGDKVRIKSLDWYNENKDNRGFICFVYANFIPEMSRYCGEILTINQVVKEHEQYLMPECGFAWTDEMIEGLVEDTITTNEPLFVPSNISLEKEMEWNLPDGYIFKDENGNVINATKIVLEKKKKEYPKIYEECCEIMQVARPTIWFDYNDVSSISEEGDEYERHIENILCAFRKLLICRDAYWKIAGEEMRLGKPWEPNWQNDEQFKYIIICRRGCIIKDTYTAKDIILSFPTAEMRDAFYEAFKEEIEICKELL